ncbi:MAG TPA: tetrahydrofolate dehydrogenase/cyclohydrolase catalytic domain-containing protein, partial [Solirubrobacteraceae bacterium]|nr:tetrahydrofolate dehydrogenase/cyclohydrolase catalytic domain-containing protein [Solirubrobacteraceae bacterium]
MAATLLDGKALAARVRERIASEAAALRDEHGIVPGLATVLVGDDPASDVYVSMKGKATEAAGMLSRSLRLPADTEQDEL